MFEEMAKQQVVHVMDESVCTAAVKLALAIMLKQHPDNKDKSIFEIAYPKK